MSRTCASILSRSNISIFLSAAAQLTGVTRIGIPIGKQDVSAMGHTFHHAIGNDAGPQGQIARGQALGAGDDVRLDSKDSLGRKPMAQPPKACDHLVRDIQNIMGTTDIEAALVIAPLAVQSRRLSLKWARQ